MNDKNQYQAILRGKVASAIAEARSAEGVTHPGVKGSILEILLSKLFRPLLPSDIGVGTGQIIDAYGNKPSNQIDIVIYDKEILPPILIDDKTGFFPIESVLYTIEVKTTLDHAGLVSSHNSAKNINKSFNYLPGKIDANGRRNEHPVIDPISVIFALNSNLQATGMSEARRYLDMHKNDYSYLKAICVAGREYSYESKGGWTSLRNAEDYDEVLNLIAGITNTYRKISQSRGFPLLGHYVASDHTQTTIIPFD